MVERLGIGDAYPFDHHFLDGPMGAMHFVDEGAGEPILMLHGNPTWSFPYRRFVQAFAPTHRAVVPDHVGLSDKPAYTIDAHIDNLEGLVEALDLRDITLVMQDWGGPIGLGTAARHPDRVKRIVVIDTFDFYPPVDSMDPEHLRLRAPLRLMRARGIGDVLVRRMGLFERRAMPTAVGNKRAYAAVRRAYTGVFGSAADPGRRHGLPAAHPDGYRSPFGADPARGDGVLPRPLRRPGAHLLGHEGRVLPRRRAARLGKAAARGLTERTVRERPAPKATGAGLLSSWARGHPGRGSSCSLSTPRPANRLRDQRFPSKAAEPRRSL